MPPNANDLELFESEWAILQAVWKLQPCTAPAVQEALQTEKNWAYTTVKTLMDRMVKKHLLTTEKIRHLYLYSAAVTPAQAQKSELARTLRRAFDNALTPMMQFLIEGQRLSDDEIADLESLIKSHKRRRRQRPAPAKSTSPRKTNNHGEGQS